MKNSGQALRRRGTVPGLSLATSRLLCLVHAVHCWLPPSRSLQVSAIVRAPPSDVFKNLVQQRRTEGLGVLMGARVVEKIDANTQVG